MALNLKKKYDLGSAVYHSEEFKRVKELNHLEIEKKPARFDIINFLLSTLKRATTYLEIGVRNPADNFDRINATTKYSVDPGIEYKENPVDYPLTSDEFFAQLRSGNVLKPEIRFDVIFIDGLHTADQVDKDIQNALDFIKDDGFIVLHDCNPPTEWHAREKHRFHLSPAGYNWNGTTWKAFVKARLNKKIYTCCVDTDWGVGILSKTREIGKHSSLETKFYDFADLNDNRNELLGLVSFDELKERTTA